MSHQAIAGPYKLLEGLDSGGMGDVWRGYDAVLDRPVAVKLIRQQAVLGSPQLAEEFAKRFRREARITAKIRHPGVPQVYDAGLDDSYERLFLVMELVDGVALSSYIHPERPLPVSWAAAVAAQVATVLSYAHEVPVIHHYLKPGNILVARDGTVKVLDFGIAAILRSDVTKLTATGTPIGTYRYMAPEQVRGGRTSTQTNLYALGCILHELLCGSLLFSGATTPLRALRPDVPAALEDLVLHLLLKAPEARPADVQEVYERLRPFLPPPGQKPCPGRRTGTVRPTRPGSSATPTHRVPAPVRAAVLRRPPGTRTSQPPHPSAYRNSSARRSRRPTSTPTLCWRRSGTPRPPKCSAS